MHRFWWRRCCCADGRPPSSPTRRTGCSPTTRCNRPPLNRSPSIGPGGWPARRCTTSPARSAQSLRHCAIRPVSRWAATSIRSGSPWPGTTSPTWSCAAPTRCDPSPATPSCSPTPPAGDPGGDDSTRVTTHRRWTALLDVYRDRDLVVKCAPGIDFDEIGRLGFSGEIEVTSLDGSVREACLWSSGLAEAGVHPTRHHAGRSRTDHRRRTRRLPGGARWPLDRRP